jgi:hypothetical protein
MSILTVFPAGNIQPNVEKLIDKIPCNLDMMPFDPRLVDFVSKLAITILTDKRIREFPELAVMANFFRKKNIETQKKLYFQRIEDVVQVPRGIVFHIAPSNVDSIFLYSGLISLLCGNINIIRTSSNATSQQEFVVSILDKLVKNDFSWISNRLFLVDYGYRDEVTSNLSKICNARVVWGGNDTVRYIRNFELSPSAIEITFADKYSHFAINADFSVTLSDTEHTELIRKFHLDTTWFGQQACASPKSIAWVGSISNIAACKRRFWKEYSEHIGQEAFEDNPSQKYERLVSSDLIFTTDKSKLETELGEYPTRIMFNKPPGISPKKWHSGNGLFLEVNVRTLSEYLTSLGPKDQTITYFGFEKAALAKGCEALPIGSVAKFNNVGSALDFSPIWDNVNLYQFFCRYIAIN